MQNNELYFSVYREKKFIVDFNPFKWKVMCTKNVMKFLLQEQFTLIPNANEKRSKFIEIRHRVLN